MACARFKYGYSKKEYWEWLKNKAAENRLNPTMSEQRLIDWFKAHKIKYHFQRPILTKGGYRGYIVDFVIFHNLIIEVDGETHKNNRKYDSDRTRRVCREGYRLIRINNEDTHPLFIDSVMNEILNKYRNVNKGTNKSQLSLQTPEEGE